MESFRPYRIVIIGRKQSIDKTSLCFIVQLAGIDQTWRVEMIFEEFKEMYFTLSSEVALLPEIPVIEIASIELSYLESVQKLMNAFFQELGRRMDIVTQPLFQSFFNIPNDFTSPRPLVQCGMTVESEFWVSKTSYTDKGGLLLVGLKEPSHLSRMGKLWNLLDPVNCGEILLLDSALSTLDIKPIVDPVTYCY